MPLCVFAYTPVGENPPYTNVSRMENGDYQITVRSEVEDGTGMKPTSQMTLSRAHAAELYRSLLRDLLATLKE